MKVSFLALPVLVLATVPSFINANAQTSGDSQNGCALHGTVIDSKTGQPVRGAEVTLRGWGLSSSGSWVGGVGNRSEPTAAISDSEGHFAFDNLTPGRYRVTASRNGYVSRGPRPGAGGSLITLSSGQQSSDTIVRLTPSAVLAGRVTSEGDEPVPNVSVEAMKYNYQNERRQLTEVGTSTTDDRGEYRIWGLPPGKYYIRATHPRGQTARPGGLLYVPIFYPGVTDPSRTQPVDLHPGDEATGIDLNFVSMHSVRVSGRVLNANSQPEKGAQVSLVGGSGSFTFTAGQASSDAKGAFEIRAVPPGSYTLIAEQFGNGENDKVMRGRSPLDVGETNITDAEVVTGPGASVSGHVRIEGKNSADLSKLSVILDPQDDMASLGFAPDVSNVHVLPDGSFQFHDVPEGTYRINVIPLPNGYYLKPGGEGDAVEAGVKVGRNRSAAVDLTLSAGAGRVSGTVSKDDQAFPGATVVLVPDPPRRAEPRFYRQALTDSGGHFNIQNVIPGNYKLFAWEEIDRGAYFDLDFLQSYEDSGKAVSIEEGSAPNVELELIQGSE
ncbi:MAG TPA: carboxypeptidase-like regulatory domain-containing protein [Candidatus Sulfotelmatobacter sp.]